MSSPSTQASGAETQSPNVCLLCRQRKTKCDRQLPQCGYCVKAKVDCRYDTTLKKRGLRAGYVSELEARLEVLEHELSSLSDSVRADSMLRSSANAVPDSRADGVRDHGKPLPATETANAKADLESLPLPLIHHLVDVWFRQLQPWCPIIQRTRIQASLDSLSAPVTYVDDLVLRAVLALTVSFSTQAISLGYSGRQRLSKYLRSAVLAEALAQISISSLQALLIIIILDYGADEVPSAWSLLSVCRRLCEQIGLFKQLGKRTEDPNLESVGPLSMELDGDEELAMPLTWVTLALDSGSTLGAAWCTASVSSNEQLASVAYIDTPYFVDSFRTATHLAVIGLQSIYASFREEEQNTQSQAMALAACETIHQSLTSYTRSQALPTYTQLPDGSVDFDPNAVLTSMLANAAIITLYEKHTSFTDSSQPLPWQQCLEACHGVSNIIRTVSDTDIEVNSPLLASYIFIAARFVLALRRATSLPWEPKFDILMHGINMCGRRWPLARRLDIVLREAIVEVNAMANGGVITRTTLPPEFWDFTKSAADIYESLKLWFRGYECSRCTGSGPYA